MERIQPITTSLTTGSIAATNDQNNLLANGNFEKGFDGWSLGNPTGGRGPAISGNSDTTKTVSFNSGNEARYGDFIEQDFRAESGKQYNVALDMLENDGGTGNHDFRVEIRDASGDVIATFDDTAFDSAVSKLSFSFTATDENLSIRIINTNATTSRGTDGKIDNVVITERSVDSDDTIAGTEANDVLVGGAGSDTIDGLSGNDVIKNFENTNLITNGDFSEGQSGWQINNPTGSHAPRVDNETFAFNRGNEANYGDSIQQDIQTEEGRTYKLSLDLIENNGGTADHDFLIEILDADGSVIETVDARAFNNETIEVNFQFVAASNASTVRITNTDATRSGNTDGKIDNVRVIEVDTGNDTFNGGDGADILIGDGGNDILNGGDGADEIHAGDGNDIVDGGAGNDKLFGGAGEDIINGGDGDDHITDTNPTNLLTNSFFEDGFDGWLVNNPTGGAGPVVINDRDFTEGVAFNSRNESKFGDSIEQNFATEIGKAYVAGAQLGEIGSASSSHSFRIEILDIDGTVIASHEQTGRDGDIDTEPFEFVATSVASTIRITNTDSTDSRSSDGFLNAVFVSEAPQSDDEFNGGAGNDRIDGQGGNDTLSGGEGNDLIHGGLGDDKIFGDDGLDTLRGEEGDDIINGGNGDDGLFGGDGNDVLDGGNGHDSVFGGEGDDIILSQFFETGDEVAGGNGVDTLDLSLNGISHNINIGTGEAKALGDKLKFNGIENITTGAGDDVVIGDSLGNVIIGGAGNDELFGRSGNDTLDGGAGNDDLFGGDGNDILIGGEGRNFIAASSGDDVVDGAFFADDSEFDGGSGTDTLDLSNEFRSLDVNFVNNSVIAGDSKAQIEDFEILLTGSGNDTVVTELNSNAVTVVTGAGDDFVQTFEGSDTVDGGIGNDTLFTDGGNDTVTGGDGNDEIFAGHGNDNVDGGTGNDLIEGGRGNDVLTGGSGADTFVFDIASGRDVITDFSVAEGDQITFSEEVQLLFGIDSADDLEIVNANGDTLIRFEEATDIRLAGVDVNDITDAAFIF